jgi:hypothetical protein
MKSMDRHGMAGAALIDLTVTGKQRFRDPQL